MSFFDWINSLCPKLQHIIHTELSTHFDYSLDLAVGATENSKLMMQREETGHYHPMYSCMAEVTAYNYIRGDSERALQDIVGMWKSSDKHRRDLLNFSNIGIGFAYDHRKDILYATACLR